MKLWSFIFTEPEQLLVSARVAAVDQFTAASLLNNKFPGLHLMMTLDSEGKPRAPSGVVCQWMGKLDTKAQGVVEATTRVQA